MRVLGLDDPEAYRSFLAADAEEWRRLDAMCRIPISRFYRDRAVFQALRTHILPQLAQRAMARGDPIIRCWSAGCASGEEAYTLGIVWRLSVQPEFRAVGIEILGTDADEAVLRRAAAACYAPGSLKELPGPYRERAFIAREDLYCVRPDIRSLVKLELQDLCEIVPAGPFDLVLCRNVVFTYFRPALQREVLSRISSCLSERAFLIVGGHERLPAGTKNFAAAYDNLPIYRARDRRAEG